jgi:host factor-I protein
MKDMDSAAVGRAPAPEPEYGNRKLIRPSLNRDYGRSEQAQAIERRERSGDRLATGPGRKQTPPEQTHAENFYYQKQMQAKTPMVLVLNDGEQVHGIIEWYDRTCVKLTRQGGGGNLLVYKSAIKYMYKEAEAR